MKKSFFSLAVLCFCLVFGSVQVSVARDFHDRAVVTQWKISSIDLLESLSADKLRRAGPNDFIMKQRLLPPAAARLNSQITGSDGKVLAREGDEFYGVATGAGSVFCSVKDPVTSPKNGVFQSLIHQALCFKDFDGDNQFDGAFRKRHEGLHLPQLKGKHRRKLIETKGGHFDLIDPVDMERQYFVGILSKGSEKLKARSKRYFSIAYGVDGNFGTLYRSVAIDNANLPQTIRIEDLGAQFSVLRSDNQDFVIRIDEPFSERYFNALLTYRFN